MDQLSKTTISKNTLRMLDLIQADILNNGAVDYEKLKCVPYAIIQLLGQILVDCPTTEDSLVRPFQKNLAAVEGLEVDQL